MTQCPAELDGTLDGALGGGGGEDTAGVVLQFSQRKL